MDAIRKIEAVQYCTLYAVTGNIGDANTLLVPRNELAAREAEIARFQETLVDLKWRVDDIRDRLLGGGTGHSVYGINEWSEPAVNLRLASKKIDAALTKQPPKD